MDTYHIVQKSRDIQRPSALEVIHHLTNGRFLECHGDRLMADDAAMIGGVGLVDELPVTFIGIQKGTTLQENLRRNFGSSGPAGYRKAQRLMKQAEKFNRPVVTLINTAGADCSPEAEKFGIGEAIAQTLLVMAGLTVPTLALILGEGGSGGAIALALADRVWMLEQATYSILSPEGFASILWKDAKLAPKAADLMKLTAYELKELQVIDHYICEQIDGQPLPKDVLIEQIAQSIQKELYQLIEMDTRQRLDERRNKFRQF
ncbi:carboxyltransferase subunit alpha [Dolosicoccus paucivorans]|uniref:acetyl-CoA carboxytransferase n=1 Tax=Dolosicoccus paucivorans TaxID=84521 RepID=A0A1G8JTP3_9LACT|nr:carboxyltransferase subunit alpha [Dolosicoccus paucivorans]PMC58061.1 acetyl-CoA carboxylase carboxyl transferase subunit alpha [Dolosicoccus paucivorans]SDI33960.1 acetyl-CoA carboxylase carboxyltransferase subunit alpha [Dolosicoccus paucivorans]